MTETPLVDITLINLTDKDTIAAGTAVLVPGQVLKIHHPSSIGMTWEALREFALQSKNSTKLLVDIKVKTGGPGPDDGGKTYKGYWSSDEVYDEGDITMYAVEISGGAQVDSFFIAKQANGPSMNNPGSDLSSNNWAKLWPTDGFRGFWQQVEDYSAGDIVLYGAEAAVYLARGAVSAYLNPPDENEYWVCLWPSGGAGGGSYRGNYNPDETYSAGDTVRNPLSVGGATSDAYWLCVQDNPGFEPNEAQDGTSWVLIGSSYNYPVGKTVNLVSTDNAENILPGSIVLTEAGMDYPAPRAWLCLQEDSQGPSYSQDDTASWVCLNRDNVKTHDFFIAEPSTAGTVLDGKHLRGLYKVIGVDAAAVVAPTTRLTVEVVCRAGVLATVVFEAGGTTGAVTLMQQASIGDADDYIGVRCTSTDSTAKAIVIHVELKWSR